MIQPEPSLAPLVCSAGMQLDQGFASGAELRALVVALLNVESEERVVEIQRAMEIAHTQCNSPHGRCFRQPIRRSQFAVHHPYARGGWLDIVNSKLSGASSRFPLLYSE